MAAQVPKKPAALMYFSAQRIGLESYEDDVPTQFISDTGEVQIGTTFGGPRSQDSTAPQSDESYVVVSWSSEQDERVNELLSKYLLVVLAANVLFAVLVVLGAISEASQVDPATPPTSPFAQAHYSTVAWVHVSIAVAISIWGAYSTLGCSSAGLSVFMAALLLNFVLGAPQAPSFLFAQRYILDLAAGYLACKLRSNLTVNWVGSTRHD